MGEQAPPTGAVLLLTASAVGQQVPGRNRDVSGGQGPPQPVPGLPAEEVPAGGHEQGR